VSKEGGVGHLGEEPFLLSTEDPDVVSGERGLLPKVFFWCVFFSFLVSTSTLGDIYNSG